MYHATGQLCPYMGKGRQGSSPPAPTTEPWLLIATKANQMLVE